MAPSNHPHPRVLKALSAGTLDAADAAAVRAHLDTCAECARLVDGEADEPIPPELLNTPDYTDIEELSRGGMGIIYTATSVMTRRQEVLKVMNRDMMKTPGEAERFLREIQSAALLDHPNIVRVLTARRFGDLMVLAMEYVPGEDLGSLVRSRGALPVVNACHYVRQAANGLQHAFEKGMVHRDIKPSNLIRTVSGKQHVVKILDFGLAKLTSETGSESGQTKTGQVLGTPDYIAPEQIRKAKSADIRADIYALGGTLYFLLTGRPPFQADNLYDLFRQHHEASPIPVHEVRSDAPPALSDVIGRMMAKDPAARYQTPKEVATALEPFVKSGTSSGKARETVVDPTEDDKLAAIYAAKTIAPAPEKVGAARPSQKVATIFTQKTEYKSPKPARLSRRSREEAEPGPKGRGKWIALGAGGICLIGLILVLALVLNPRKDGPTDRSDSASASKSTARSDTGSTGKATGPTTVDLSAGEVTEEYDWKGEKRTRKVLVLDLGDGEKIEFVRIPTGTFQMGSPESDQNETGDKQAYRYECPQHTVEISRDYYLCKYTVTNSQFKRFVSAASDTWSSTDAIGGAGHPVVNVIWNDASAFCTWANDRFQEKKGALRLSGPWSVRLPTEAEWEYACRGGTTTRWFTGDESGSLAGYANFLSAAAKPVGSYKPNPFGLYDMAGNVYQWCENKYDDVGSVRVVYRGGSWSSFARSCRSADRDGVAPGVRRDDLGFRAALVPSGP